MDSVSVIIRNKNEERWIGHTIQSVIDTFDKPEIIVVNNNSSQSNNSSSSHYDTECLPKN